LQEITLYRAAGAIATVVTGWSLNVRWGADQMVRVGAPPQFERHVVGAAALVATCAVLLAFSGPKRKSRMTVGIAGACALGAHGIAWWIRSLAQETGQPHLTTGAGWLWMLAGTGLATAAALLVLRLKPKAAQPSNAKRKRARS